MSAGLRSLRELALQHRDPLVQHLALDLGIGDLSVVGEAAQEMTLAAVEIGPGLVAAIEEHRIAAPRIADRHGEKRPREVVRQPGMRSRSAPTG